MATYTDKLNLKKPEQNDFYNVDDFNGNFDKIDEFANRTDNPHKVTKGQIGLGNVDNTSDMNKPISTAQAAAIADAKQVGNDAKASINSHINNKSNPHGVTADLVGAPKMLTYSETKKYTTVLAACNALKYGGGFVASSYTDIFNASDYPQNGYEFIFHVVCEANEARKAVIAYGYHGKNINVFQRNIFNGAWETTWKSTDESYYGQHNLPYPAQIQSGSYVGTGKSYETNKNKLELPFEPKYIYIEAYDTSENEFSCLSLSKGMTQTVVRRHKTNSTTHNLHKNNVTWSGNSVEWWYYASDTNAGGYQCNSSGVTYHYIAIG